MLRQLVAEGDWAAVASCMDADFFRLLLTDENTVSEAFRAAPPEWFEKYPRQVMSRALLDAARQPQPVLDDQSIAVFAAWVAGQPSPATRDVLGVLLGRMRGLMAVGRHEAAATIANDVLHLVASAPDVEGFLDVLPSTFLRAGTVVLLAGRLEESVVFFEHAVRWATRQNEHPMAVYARERNALCLALTGRYRAAHAVRGDAPTPQRARPGSAHYHLQGAGPLARCLIGIGTLNQETTRLALAALDEGVMSGDFWWTAIHARARHEMLWGNTAEAVELLQEQLTRDRVRLAPERFAGARLRADLADAHQAAGDLRAAERVLRQPSLAQTPSVRLSALRLHLLRGDARATIDGLRNTIGEQPTPFGLAHLPAGLVLLATAEHAATGYLNDRTLRQATAAIHHHNAPYALIEASPAVRDALCARLQVNPALVPDMFTHLDHPRLTRREQEILRLLSTGDTITDMAASLHVSPNTVRTHLKRLYRKLDVHTRDEALWMAHLQ